ncbi:MAG: spermidine/putrescine ABC transporter permease PotC, partial [Oscillochloris sp.]|nr:spermidine/putrescine ABC transporter permease PotC [Oscillochloris sp.]
MSKASRALSPVARRRSWGGLALAVNASVLYLFLYVPIVILVIFSFT